MNFYHSIHRHYCGIDLHARSLYVCIIDQEGEVLLHKEIKAQPEPLLALLDPFRDDLIVGVECMHCWYWISDLCEEHGINFILGHALYMKAIHGGKTKNDRIDSFKIAMLMKGGNFPLAYVYPKAMRATRDLLRRRTRIVQHGAMLKAHVVNTTSQYNLPANKVNLKTSVPGNRFDWRLPTRMCCRTSTSTWPSSSVITVSWTSWRIIWNSRPNSTILSH
jgi:hypothetical protein